MRGPIGSRRVPSVRAGSRLECGSIGSVARVQPCCGSRLRGARGARGPADTGGESATWRPGEEEEATRGWPRKYQYSFQCIEIRYSFGARCIRAILSPAKALQT
eukprot:883037-Prymnesium_polylepis.1